MVHTVVIQDTPLNIVGAMQAVTHPQYGAIDMFIGTVRNTHESTTVTGITYDIHTVLAEKILRDICNEAQAKWADTAYYVAHYRGYVPVQGISVIIAVASPHRAESFKACQYVIEQIKKRGPIWKNEHYTHGESGWLSGHSLRIDSDTR